MSKTAIGLVEYAKAQLGRPYWYGSFGQSGSKEFYEQKKNQYPNQYTWDYDGTTEKVHDCVGLIKGYLWCDSPEDTTPIYDAVQDKSANGMRNACKIKGEMNTFPHTIGTLVFFEGHVGIYEGNGYVIEARGHAFGVVRTKLTSRNWKWWGYCPFIEYIDEEPQKPIYIPTVREWQQAAEADGFKFSEYGVDGIWGRECEKIAKKAVVKRRVIYTYPALTKIVQRVVGTTVDGKCGKNTEQAIKNYQAANGLLADGKCGVKTWMKILNV